MYITMGGLRWALSFDVNNLINDSSIYKIIIKF